MRLKRFYFDTPGRRLEISSRSGAIGRATFPTIKRAIRFNMRSIWLSSFADLTNPARIHFYALHRSYATRVIFDSLGIPRRRSAQAAAVQSSDEVGKRLAN